MSGVVVVLSGGMDSSALLASLMPNVRAAVSIDYGQRHSRELTAASLIAEHFGVRWVPLQLEGLKYALGGSSQTDRSIPVPDGHYQDASMRITVVPNRNMILLAVAIGYAISIGADTVAYGAHSGDHAVYPDCRPEFADAMAVAARLCHYEPGITLARPFVGWTKAEIAAEGARLGVPFELTWSCYKGGEAHCGTCGTCVERKEAFLLAGVPDPTEYLA